MGFESGGFVILHVRVFSRSYCFPRSRQESGQEATQSRQKPQKTYQRRYSHSTSRQSCKARNHDGQHGPYNANSLNTPIGTFPTGATGPTNGAQPKGRTIPGMKGDQTAARTSQINRWLVKQDNTSGQYNGGGGVNQPPNMRPIFCRPELRG